MKQNALRLISLLLTLSLLLGCVCVSAFAQEKADVSAPAVNKQAVTKQDLPSFLTNPDIDPADASNTVIIPGVFQSCVRLYNSDGTVAVNSDGEEYEGPFFMESTGDVVKIALKKVLAPLLVTLITQHDWFDWLGNSFEDAVGEIIGSKIRSDANGNLNPNLRADNYPGSVATLTQEEKDYIYDQIPLRDYTDLVGEDHLYFFSYVSFDNIDKLSGQLYSLIQKAAAESPTGKANIVPISQGGSLANALLNNYPDVGQYLDRIIYIVPALDGTVLFGEIYEKGFIDDDVALYKEILPVLLYDDDSPYTGALVNIVLRILPNKVLNSILDHAVDGLINGGIRYSTCMWALIASGNYQGAAEKYLSAPEDAVIRAQTDKFYQAQIHSTDNIKHQMDTYGVEVFDVVDYNYTLYPICDSWKSVNADGIIDLASESMGATGVAVNQTLPADYVPAKGSKYIDKYNLIDAGTGFLPDQTFYFHNQNHESTARNDVVMKLAICLMTDDNFTSVDSYPEKYPQFNEARNGHRLEERITEAEEIDPSALSEQDATQLNRLILEGKKQLATTVVCENCDNITAELQILIDRAKGEEDKNTEKNEKLTVVLGKISDFLYNTMGGKGFSDALNPFSYLGK